MTKKPKERILEKATELFLRDGYHATGIDKIVAEANVAKMTLYNHFPSKNELIVAALKHRDQSWRAWFESRVNEVADTPKERLLAMFDVLQEWFVQEDFFGCAFINAAAEYGKEKESNKILDTIEEHKLLLALFVEKLAIQAGAADAKNLSLQLAALLEGAIVLALILRNPEVAQETKGAAKVLIEQATE